MKPSAAYHIAKAAEFQDILDAQLMNTEPYAAEFRLVLRAIIESHVRAAVRVRETERAAQEVERRAVTSGVVN